MEKIRGYDTRPSYNWDEYVRSHDNWFWLHIAWIEYWTDHTFRLWTKSAVSNSVNWDIWSTIEEILGLVVCVVASVLCHLRCRLVWDCCDELRRQWEDRECGWRVASWHVRDRDLTGAETVIFTTLNGKSLEYAVKRRVDATNVDWCACYELETMLLHFLERLNSCSPIGQKLIGKADHSLARN